MDENQNILVTDENCIRMITPSGYGKINKRVLFLIFFSENDSRKS